MTSAEIDHPEWGVFAKKAIHMLAPEEIPTMSDAELKEVLVWNVAATVYRKGVLPYAFDSFIRLEPSSWSTWHFEQNLRVKEIETRTTFAIFDFVETWAHGYGSARKPMMTEATFREFQLSLPGPVRLKCPNVKKEEIDAKSLDELVDFANFDFITGGHDIVLVCSDFSVPHTPRCPVRLNPFCIWWNDDSKEGLAGQFKFKRVNGKYSGTFQNTHCLRET